MDENDLLEEIASLIFEYKYPRNEYHHLSWRDAHFYPDKEREAYNVAKRIARLIKK